MRYEVYAMYEDGTSTLYETYDTFEEAEEAGLRFQDEYREVFGCEAPFIQITKVDE